MAFRSGFVSIFGKPNAGKSTLLNAIIGEKMAIVSHKVQTTRHRIKAFLNTDSYQLIFSDTPGIIDPKYRLHEKMMGQVKAAMEDADCALLVYDLGDLAIEEADALFQSLKLKVPCILVLNKADSVNSKTVEDARKFFTGKPYAASVCVISAMKGNGVDTLLETLLGHIPEAPPYYDPEQLSDLPEKFFVSELIREKIYELYHEEIPYQTAVLIQRFEEKQTLTKIVADIIVQRETQKFILIGEGGKMIKMLGTRARQSIEEFLGRKVFLELLVRVKPKWRNDEWKLREYGY